MTRIPVGLLLALLVLTVVSTCFAQLPTGTILGVVKDSSGAVVPGATVTIRNVETDLTRTITTSDDGAFRVPALPVGHYTVKFEKSGFKTETQTSITLEVAQELAVNSALQVGTSAQEITVTADVPLVSTTTSSLGTLVSEQKIADLPLNGRNYNDLTLLQPGVTKHQNATTTNLGNAGTAFSSNGASIRSNTYLLDGAPLVNLVGGNGASAIGTTLGVDGIQEYRVITNSFSAEYGGTMGSQMILVSKSGTNRFHGDAFEFLRNSDLDARNFFDLPPSQLGRRLPLFQRNNFGGALGGPIRKDKTFFFVVYEGLAQNLGTTNTANVLDAGCHGLAGAVITGAECPQVGSASTSVTIAPQIAPLLALYPIPNIGTSQYGFNFPQPTSEHYGQVRMDQTVSSTDSFFGRYTIDQASQTSPYDYPGFVTILGSRNQFLTLAENHIFSTALINSARFSFSRTNLTIASPSSFEGPQYSFVTGLPIGNLAVGGLTTNGTYNGAPQTKKQNIFIWSDDVNYTHGSHSLKFGFLFNHYQMFIDSSGQSEGIATFSGNATTTSVAAFLAGQLTGVGTYSQVAPGSLVDRTFHFDVMGFYAEDDWRATSRLTLNLGLRYEPGTTYNEIHGISAALRDFVTDTSTTLGPPFKNPTLRNFGPRVGFAWDVTGNGHTAIRGGFAELYDLATYGTQLVNAAKATPPFDSNVTVSSGTFTVPFVLPTGAALSSTFTGPDYFMRQPHMLQYNLTLERKLPGSMGLTVAYVGSRGMNLLQSKEGNPKLPNGIPVGGACVAPPSGTVINYGSQVDGAATSCWLSSAAPRINTNWANLTIDPGAGDSHYNGLEVVLNKQVSKGLQFQSSYTWSKLLDDTQGAAGLDNNAASVIGGNDFIHKDWGVADFDVASNWRFNAIYRLPRFSQSSGYMDKLVNGWWVSGIYTYESGYPFGAYLSFNRSFDELSSTIERADVVPAFAMNPRGIVSGSLSTACGNNPAGTALGTPTLYYDPCAFAVQPAGFLGNEPRNFLRGPSLNNLDFSLVKDTTLKFLGESGAAEFRAEFFNILNKANFAVPSGVTVYSSATSNPVSSAGAITTTVGTSRQIQFGLKILF